MSQFVNLTAAGHACRVPLLTVHFKNTGHYLQISEKFNFILFLKIVRNVQLVGTIQIIDKNSFKFPYNIRPRFLNSHKPSQLLAYKNCC